MENDNLQFIRQNSPDGALMHALQDKDFLQSSEWRKFQESAGRKIYCLDSKNFYAGIIEHALPIVGKYFYIPRGPVINEQGTKSKEHLEELINLAKEKNAGWIRFDPATDEILDAMRSNTSSKIVKAPHDMQPKELFIIGITKPEEQLLAEMKSKTRYNIKVAQKHGVKIWSMEHRAWNKRYVDEFFRLTQVMAKRQGIETHPGSYYEKMCQNCPCIRLYAAEYQDKIIAANLVVFYGKTCIYLHGASDDSFRNVMAPFLLQWQQIKDAKAAGCERYDFGGVKVESKEQRAKSKKSWEGITRFKLGFSPNTESTEFPGSYDIVVNPVRYWAYRSIQKLKSLIK